MLTLYPNLILDALTHVRYPGTGKNIVEMGMIEDLYVCVYMLNAVKIKLNYVSV